MLFETNGIDEQQNEQISVLKGEYAQVKMLADCSEDDPGQKKRKLFFCESLAAGDDKSLQPGEVK